MKGHKLLIHHLRHATFVVEVEEKVILVDPMLGHKGSIIPFAVLRHRARLNPTVELPSNAAAILDKVNHAVITHRHPDHLDRAGVRFLRERSIPVTCSYKDSNRLRKKRLNLQAEVKYWEKTPFLSGHITGIPARHGYGFIAGLMGNVMGFVIEMANAPTLYISSDTIYSDDVHKVLTSYKPEVSVLAAGAAQLDIGAPLLMHQEDILTFLHNSPGKIYANHMEAINHCPVTRKHLQGWVDDSGMKESVFIPADGDSIDF
jgi:L-ascorbate metabolism protein UlaG (beta-lactamase superfamily)